MSKARWALVVAALGALVVFTGDALAKKGGGGKPGGGDPPNTTPPDIAYRLNQQLWVMQDDGSGKMQITGDGAFRASWSPDGTQLAFEGNGFGSGLGPGIYVIDADGSNLVRVTHHSGTALSRVEWCPQPAPDGTQWLAFNEPDPTSGSTDIFLVSLDGTIRRNVTAQLETASGPIGETVRSWSPDGTRLLYFAGTMGTGGFRVIEFSYDGDGELVLPSAFIDIVTTPSHGTGEWAKTGDQVVFMEIVGGLGDLFVVDFSDLDNISAPVNITNTPDREEGWPSWSADDTEVVCSSEGEILVYDVSSGAARSLARYKGRKTPGQPSWRRGEP